MNCGSRCFQTPWPELIESIVPAAAYSSSSAFADGDTTGRHWRLRVCACMWEAVCAVCETVCAVCMCVGDCVCCVCAQSGEMEDWRILVHSGGKSYFMAKNVSLEREWAWVRLRSLSDRLGGLEQVSCTGGAHLLLRQLGVTAVPAPQVAGGRHHAGLPREGL